MFARRHAVSVLVLEPRVGGVVVDKQREVGTVGIDHIQSFTNVRNTMKSCVQVIPDKLFVVADVLAALAVRRFLNLAHVASPCDSGKFPECGCDSVRLLQNRLSH